MTLPFRYTFFYTVATQNSLAGGSLNTMNFELLRHHNKLISAVIAMIAMTLTITLLQGEPKLKSEIEWLDIVGEGGIALISLMWIFFILISRPAGMVTTMLVTGLLFVHCSLLLDLIDEFLHYPHRQFWLLAYESLPAPIGMILMTFGLYHWHKEQLEVNQQLRRRERVYREHGLIDYITGLYSADYMMAQVQQELRQLTEYSTRNFSLLMLDIDAFDTFVRQHGDVQADRFLREVSELILINIRTSDLACRYAGDRFIVLLPQTSLTDAQQIAQQLQQAIAHFAFKPEKSARAVYQNMSVSVAPADANSSLDSLMAELNQQMENIKLAVKNKSVA
ncbi:GGDEF domain-containing protein [Saccharobesus litoralis]|uniref:diguanylate cyclase n=1 Tax=Saccharobesus litoralis TaxID=2172099 RepID=A0A2S0VQN5_9ALTE|nr:diguanylate cyclase [Saccharobesus litoralis]AWB66400.1 GGDEF domain-containing protein [Saccharobesus litoralis]